jgi:hypothetical protein
MFGYLSKERTTVELTGDKYKLMGLELGQTLQ